MLQFNDLRVNQKKKPCIRVNTRELNWELCTRLSTLYTKYLLLWLVPQRYNIEMDLEYNDTIGCTEVVSVSALYSRCSKLAIFSYFMTCLLHGLCIVSLCNTCIYNIDTILYPYALPLISSLYFFSSLCLSTTWALA